MGQKEIYSKFNNSHTKGLKVTRKPTCFTNSTTGFQMLAMVKEDFIAIKMCMSNLPDQLKNLSYDIHIYCSIGKLVSYRNHVRLLSTYCNILCGLKFLVWILNTRNHCVNKKDTWTNIRLNKQHHGTQQKT